MACTNEKMIYMLYVYRRYDGPYNDNGVTTQVVIEIRSHYPRDGPMHNEMMLFMLYV
jgi:hypothetical protein